MVTLRLEVESEQTAHAVADRLRDLSDFHLVAMTFMTQRVKERLAAKLKGGHHTNRLGRSWTIGAPDNVFRHGRDFAEAGSALPYARKVNEGGTIRPREMENLAIPLTDKLRRMDDNWPRDIDPGRDILEFIPLEGKHTGLLINPDDPDMRWLLTPEVDWGEGYGYAEFREDDRREILLMLSDHVTVEA